MFLFINLFYFADALYSSKVCLVGIISSLECERNAEIKSANDFNNFIIRNHNFDNSVAQNTIENKRGIIRELNNKINIKKRELEYLNIQLRNICK